MLVYKGLFISRNIMPVIKNTGPTISENPDELYTKMQAEEQFRIDWENADFEAGSRGLMEWFNMSPFDQHREKEAQTRIAQLEAQEAIAESDLLTDIETAGSIEGDAAHEIYASLWGTENNAQANDKPEESIEKVSQIVPEWEYVALFRSFLKKWNISPKDFEALHQANITSENYHEKISNLDINPQKKTELSKSLGYLNNPERIEKGKLELHKEFSWVFEPHIKKGDGTPEWKSHFHGEAFEKIAQHYIWGNTKTPEEKEIDFRMACTMAADDLWNRAQVNLNPSNTEFFNKNFRVAKNPTSSKAECFEALANISQIINKTEWVKGKTKLVEQRRISWRRKLEQTQKFEEFNQLITDRIIARQEKNNQKNQEIDDRLQAITQEAQLTSWEVTALWWWEADVMSDTLSQNPTESV